MSTFKDLITLAFYVFVMGNLGISIYAPNFFKSYPYLDILPSSTIDNSEYMEYYDYCKRKKRGYETLGDMLGRRNYTLRLEHFLGAERPKEKKKYDCSRYRYVF